MSVHFGRLVIVGLGLIGGSLAKALKAHGAVDDVIGYGRSAESLQKGVDLGVIDAFSLDLAAAVQGADIVVIAAPTLSAENLLTDVLKLVPATTIVTDVASVKGNLQRAAEKVFGEMPANVVLAHPIAGSEQSGVTAARADLFQSNRVILTPTAATDAKALAHIRAMWETTGAVVSEMGVDEHDSVLAATSHLPHVLAFALVDAFAGDPASRDIFRYAGGGFRDFTRIAASDPQMWHDIALANRPALLGVLDRFTAHLDGLRSAIDRADGLSIMAAFARAKDARDEFAELLKQRQSSSHALSNDSFINPFIK
ncbi:MAG: prephenate dehydrogenase/arogenate dehydrogenase family protein [Spongiibacteraceae bacterium]